MKRRAANVQFILAAMGLYLAIAGDTAAAAAFVAGSAIVWALHQDAA
jgi:hypothetical protein